MNEAREITEKVIDELHIPGNGKKPRTYRKKARKQYLQIARSKKKNQACFFLLDSLDVSSYLNDIGLFSSALNFKGKY